MRNPAVKWGSGTPERVGGYKNLMEYPFVFPQIKYFRVQIYFSIKNNENMAPKDKRLKRKRKREAEFDEIEQKKRKENVILSGAERGTEVNEYLYKIKTFAKVCESDKSKLLELSSVHSINMAKIALQIVNKIHIDDSFTKDEIKTFDVCKNIQLSIFKNIILSDEERICFSYHIQQLKNISKRQLNSGKRIDLSKGSILNFKEKNRFSMLNDSQPEEFEDDDSSSKIIVKPSILDHRF